MVPNVMGQYCTVYIIAADVEWRGVEAEMARRGVVVGGGNTGGAAGEGRTGAGGTGGASRWAAAAVLARLVQV